MSAVDPFEGTAYPLVMCSDNFMCNPNVVK